MSAPSNSTASSEQRVHVSTTLGLISFILSLLYPLAMIANVITVFVIDGFKYPLAFFYSALDYIGCPLVLVALMLAFLALVTGPTTWGRRGLIVSGASLALIVLGVALALGSL